jgi:hypothetical protein
VVTTVQIQYIQVKAIIFQVQLNIVYILMILWIRYSNLLLEFVKIYAMKYYNRLMIIRSNIEKGFLGDRIL